MITVEAGMVSDAATAIREIDGVQKIYIVTGPFDIVVIAEIPERSKFRGLVDSIHEAPGINRTETCIAI
ncbi:MAG: Lrp/AsnC family transcriptional regulator [Candidatus Thorarchaeota archaeon]|nr:Lrp/AsnC family transcriptional regulator [Candidatus Thorarchaeota archaeon]